MSEKGMPPMAALLGVLGLIPFFAGAIASLTSVNQLFGLPVAVLLLGYGMCILSFMGGVHWGLAMRDDRPVQYGISVIAALYAWPALMLSVPIALLYLAFGFAFLLGFEIWAQARDWTSPWYLALRYRLSFGAIIALAAASVGWGR